MFIATLVAPERLSAGDISAACDAVGGMAGPMIDHRACDIDFVTGSRDRLEAAVSCDVIVQRAADRHRKLLVADMDSTMITVECIDELADYAGLKAEVSAVTERAMRGEIDFAGALRDRVALLAGMSEETIAQCLAERVRLTGGARALVQAFRASGGTAILVSGGFTHFTGPVAEQIGFDRAVANHLVVKDGALTGEVKDPIIDAEAKRATLLGALAERGLSALQSVAIGDGANDIPMIEAAGLGIAYHAKPRTEAAADARIRYGNLDVVRYALGLQS